MDWTTIRELCEAQGLAKDLRDFERSLAPTLARSLMEKTGKMEQYLTDNKFRAQVDLLCVITVHVLTQASTPTQHMRDAFTDEVKRVMG